MRADGDDRVAVTLGGTVRPPGGIVIVSPFDRPIRSAIIDGSEQVVTDPHQVTLRDVAGRAVLIY